MILRAWRMVVMEAIVTVGSAVWIMGGTRVGGAREGIIAKVGRAYWTTKDGTRIPNARDHDNAENSRLIPRNVGGSLRAFLTQKALADYCYAEKWRYRIGAAVERCHDAAVLRDIADRLKMETT